MSAADATEDGAVEGAVERGHAVMSAAGSDALESKKVVRMSQMKAMKPMCFKKMMNFLG